MVISKTWPECQMIWSVVCCFISIYIVLSGVVLGDTNEGMHPIKKRKSSKHLVRRYDWTHLDPKNIPKTPNLRTFFWKTIYRKLEKLNKNSFKTFISWDFFWPEIPFGLSERSQTSSFLCLCYQWCRVPPPHHVKRRATRPDAMCSMARVPNQILWWSLVQGF